MGPCLAVDLDAADVAAPAARPALRAAELTPSSAGGRDLPVEGDAFRPRRSGADGSATLALALITAPDPPTPFGLAGGGSVLTRVARRMIPMAATSRMMIPSMSGRIVDTTGDTATMTATAETRITWSLRPLIRRMPSGPSAVRAKAAKTAPATARTPPRLT